MPKRIRIETWAREQKALIDRFVQDWKDERQKEQEQTGSTAN